MMKKWMLLVAGGLMAVNAAQAKESWCGYKDFFHLSNDVHPGVYIVSAFNDPDIVLQIVGPKSFILRDNGQCTSGFSHVTVGYDVNNWCVLDIKDGPWLNTPAVKASCNGMKFLGIRYDGFGTYSYTIDLD